MPAARRAARRSARRPFGWSREAAELLSHWTTFEGGLPQGAPTSPRLSNLVNHGFDARVAAAVARRKGTYTRYADDIAISFPKNYPRRMRGIIQRIRAIARSHGYRVHGPGKIRIMRPHQQQRVTGLVVNERARLPRKTRRWLRAVEHRIATGGKPSLTEAQLKGWQAYAEMIERGCGSQADRESSRFAQERLTSSGKSST